MLEFLKDSDVLSYLALDEAWLIKQLAYQEITDLKDVFFASISPTHVLQLSLKDESDLKLPLVKH